MVSHYDWGENGAVIARARRREIGDHYFLFRDGTREAAPIGALFRPIAAVGLIAPHRIARELESPPSAEWSRGVVLALVSDRKQ